MGIVVVHGASGAAAGQAIGGLLGSIHRSRREKIDDAKDERRLKLYENADQRAAHDRAEADAIGGAQADAGSSELTRLGSESSALARSSGQQAFASTLSKSGSPMMAGAAGAAALSAQSVDPQEIARIKKIAESLKADGYPQAAAKLLTDFGETVKGRIVDREQQMVTQRMERDLARAADGRLGPYLAPAVKGISALLQAARKAPAAQRASIVNRAMGAYQTALAGAQKQYQFEQEKLRLRTYVATVGEQVAALPPGDRRQVEFEMFAAGAETMEPEEVYENGMMIANDLVKLGDGRFMSRSKWEAERDADIDRREQELELKQFEFERRFREADRRMDETERHNRAVEEKPRGGSAATSKFQITPSAITARAKTLAPVSALGIPGPVTKKERDEAIRQLREEAEEFAGPAPAPTPVKGAGKGIEAADPVLGKLTAEQRAAYDKASPEAQAVVRKRLGGK